MRLGFGFGLGDPEKRFPGGTISAIQPGEGSQQELDLAHALGLSALHLTLTLEQGPWDF